MAETKENIAFKHCISLGYFCSVASELERLGLRDSSYPFDWCISSFQGVVKAIDSRFSNFLQYDNLYQERNSLSHYKDCSYDITFYHDFDKYHSLQEQLPQVIDKYQRRIQRFYEAISEPTLFIRYISDETIKDGKSVELQWIEEHYNDIMCLIKKYNESNAILFIANDGVVSNMISIYHVGKDKNDSVARKPLDKNKALYQYLNEIDYPDRPHNLAVYQKKRWRDKLRKYYCKLKPLVKDIFVKSYIHDKQF